MEELKADSIEKETRIAHLEVKIQEFTSSIEKAQKEAVIDFMRSAKIKTRLNRHYTTGYEDFRADVKEAYPEMDFESFTIPTVADSSMLPTSSEEVNVVDDATTEIAQDEPKSGVMPLVVYPSDFIFLLKNILFQLVENACCFRLHLFFFFF